MPHLFRCRIEHHFPAASYITEEPRLAGIRHALHTRGKNFFCNQWRCSPTCAPEFGVTILVASDICSGVRLALVTFNLTIISLVIGYGFLILIPVGSPGPLPYFGLTKTIFSNGLYTLYSTKGSSTEFFAYKSSRMFFPFKSISIVPRSGQNETQLTPSLSIEWQHSNAGLSPFTVTVTFWFLSIV